MNTSYSGIALAEAAGPMRSLFDRLTGRRPRFWLKSLNKFLRMENPWVHRNIFRAEDDGTRSFEDVVYGGLKALKEKKLTIVDELENIPKIKENNPHLSQRTSTFPCNIVEVHLKDLIPKGTYPPYELFLEDAKKDYGLEPCPLGYGLEACAESMMKRVPGEILPRLYLVCTQQISSRGNRCLPFIRCNIPGTGSGLACFHSIGNDLFVHEMILIFSMPC